MGQQRIEINFISENQFNTTAIYVGLFVLYGLSYSSPNIVRVIKSRRMRRAGHEARMGEERGCIGSWWGNGGKETTGET